jgi:hypothetical protein
MCVCVEGRHSMDRIPDLGGGWRAEGGAPVPALLPTLLLPVAPLLLVDACAQSQQNADDEAYDRAARSNSIAEQAGDGHHVAVVQAPQLTPAVEEDIEGFQNKFTDTVRGVAHLPLPFGP